MHALTIAVLTALHALSHRIDLTAAEMALLDGEGPRLCPDVWKGHRVDARRCRCRWRGCDPPSRLRPMGPCLAPLPR